MSPAVRARLRWIGLLTAVLVAVGIPLLLRAGWEATAALNRANAAREAGDVDLAVELLGHAARWRVPGSTADDDALDDLLEIANDADSRGGEGRPMALRAYREARRSLLATRAWGIPRADDFHLANRRIAALMAAQERDFGTDVGGTGDPEAYHLRLLEAVPGPVPWRANLAALAFLLWIGFTVMFVARALDAQGRLRPRPAVRWGIAALVVLITWLLLTRYAG